MKQLNGIPAWKAALGIGWVFVGLELGLALLGFVILFVFDNEEHSKQISDIITGLFFISVFILVIAWRLIDKEYEQRKQKIIRDFEEAKCKLIEEQEDLDDLVEYSHTNFEEMK